MLRTNRLTTLTAAFLTAGLCAALTGCGFSPEAVDTTEVTGAAIHGVVFGGQQPLTGAHVYVMAAATSGYGAASKSLITTSSYSDAIGKYVLTDASGSFSLTGVYSCTPGQQVYILSTQGNPGLAPGTNNTAAFVATLLGNCPAAGTFAGSVPFLTINEVSTVAAAYAISGFATDYAHVSSASTAQSIAGMKNAFATFNNLVSLQYGQAYTTTPAVSGYGGGLSANGIVPKAEIYTLANVLAGCINSNGTSGGCTQLFANAKNSGGTLPANTFDAILNIAHNPGANVAAIANLAPTTPPFQPNLSATPNDWTLQVKFSAPTSSYPGRVAVDANGNIWVPNSGNNTMTELSPAGVVLSGNGGFTGGGMNQPITPWIDAAGYVWVSNENSGTITKFSSSGVPVSTTGYTNPNNTIGYGMTVASQTGNIVVTGNYGVTQFSSSSPTTSVFNDASSTHNTAVLEDANHMFWATSYDGNSLKSINGSGVVTTYTGGGMSNPVSLARDASGNFWISSYTGNAISKFSSTGSAVSSTGYTGAGVHEAYAVVVDGAGGVFAGNSNGSLSQLTNTGGAVSPSTGFTTACTTPSYGVAADPSGNVWMSCTDSGIYEFIGLSTPVATPIAYNNAGTRP